MNWRRTWLGFLLTTGASQLAVAQPALEPDPVPTPEVRVVDEAGCLQDSAALQAEEALWAELVLALN